MNNYLYTFTAITLGFYLGYSRGRSFPQNAQLPPQKILLSLQYISNYIGKTIQTRRVQCTWSRCFLSVCNISQNCLKMHYIAFQRIFISKNFRGSMITTFFNLKDMFRCYEHHRQLQNIWKTVRTTWQLMMNEEKISPFISSIFPHSHWPISFHSNTSFL